MDNSMRRAQGAATGEPRQAPLRDVAGLLGLLAGLRLLLLWQVLYVLAVAASAVLLVPWQDVQGWLMGVMLQLPAWLLPLLWLAQSVASTWGWWRLTSPALALARTVERAALRLGSLVALAMLLMSRIGRLFAAAEARESSEGALARGAEGLAELLPCVGLLVMWRASRALERRGISRFAGAVFVVQAVAFVLVSDLYSPGATVGWGQAIVAFLCARALLWALLLGLLWQAARRRLQTLRSG